MSRSVRLPRPPAQSSEEDAGGQALADRRHTLHVKADYIQDMVDEMRRMADDAGFDLLAYILDMAFIEAGHVKKRTVPELKAPEPVCQQDED